MRYGFVKDWPWWKDALMGAGLLAAVVLIAMLAGCSTTTSAWVNPQKQESVFYMDEGQCQAQALSAPTSSWGDRSFAIFDACMRGKGWFVVHTTWTGRSSIDFGNDDFQCSGAATSPIPIRGPKWRQCLLDRGWKPDS